MPPARKPLAIRLWSKVDRRGPNECWEWTGCRDSKGYGSIARGGRFGGSLKTHRVAWALTNGPISDGLSVCHKCDNPPCCNPAHHFLGTLSDNNADMKAKGRQSMPPVRRGERNNRTKLKGSDVRMMRDRYSKGGISLPSLARLFGMSNSAAYAIVQRRTWIGEIYEPS